MPSLLAHLSVFAFLLFGSLKDSPERKLVSKLAGAGQPLDIARTLAMAIGGLALSSFVVLAMVTVSDLSFCTYRTTD